MSLMDSQDQKLLLSPSLMCGDLLNLGNQITELKQMGIDYLHIDIADMHFVPNITLGFALVEQVASFNIPLDIHLMVENPLLVVDKLKLSKNDIISFHVNPKNSVFNIIEIIKKKGHKTGLVISPDVPVLEIKPYIDQVDLVQVMCVQPGFSGQKFIPESYDRVEELRRLITNKTMVIGVDGAIGYEQIKKFYTLGVRLFVLGSAILFNQRFEENMHQINLFITKLKNDDPE